MSIAERNIFQKNDQKMTAFGKDGKKCFFEGFRFGSGVIGGIFPEAIML